MLIATAIAALVMLAVGTLWPLRNAGLHADDWAWLAVSVHAGIPTGVLFENHLFGFYYRPTSVLAWWLVTTVAGTEPAWQYGVTWGLHALGALAVGEFTRAMTGSWRRAALAALLVVVAPPVSGTALWLSNRSEALVLIFGFLAMRLALAETERLLRALLVALCLWAAATSKETGFAFVPAVVLLMAARSGLRALLTPVRIGAVVLPVAFALIPRPMATVTLHGSADSGALASLFIEGGQLWLERLPDAWGGWGMPGLLPATTALLAMLLLTAGVIRMLAERRLWELSALATLVVVAALAQSPITTKVLGDPASLQFLVNLRFFSIGTAGLVVIAAFAPAIHQSDVRQITLVLAVTCLTVVWGAQSYRQAERWSRDTREESGAMLDGIAGSLSLSTCPPSLPEDALPAGLRGYADLLYKAKLPRGDARLGCVVRVGDAPTGIILLPRPRCAHVPALDGWVVLVRDGRRFVEPFGDLCQVVYQRDPHRRTTERP